MEGNVAVATQAGQSSIRIIEADRPEILAVRLMNLRNGTDGQHCEFDLGQLSNRLNRVSARLNAGNHIRVRTS